MSFTLNFRAQTISLWSKFWVQISFEYYWCLIKFLLFFQVSSLATETWWSGSDRTRILWAYCPCIERIQKALKILFWNEIGPDIRWQYQIFLGGLSRFENQSPIERSYCLQAYSYVHRSQRCPIRPMVRTGIYFPSFVLNKFNLVIDVVKSSLLS